MSGPADPVAVPPGVPVPDPARALEARLARVLRRGTWLAVGLVAAGVAATAGAGVDPLAARRPPFLDPGALPGDLAALRPAGLLWAGLLLLAALPVVRVVVAGAGFLRAGDRRQAAVAAAVVLVVFLSIASARLLEA